LNSPFSATKTQKIFKNTANLTLKGSTFDAFHLDSFLHSQYGAKNSGQGTKTTTNASLYGGISRTQAKKASASYIMGASSIRPSVAFVSMDRSHPTQSTYVDVYDGPSSLQKRDNLPTLKEKQGVLPYESEREKHLANLRAAIQENDEANQRLWGDSPSIRSPQQRRDDIDHIKTKLEIYNAIKAQHKFYGKRDRLIRVGWRHGILGVEDADATDSQSVFYDSAKIEKAEKQRERNIINSHRKDRNVFTSN